MQNKLASHDEAEALCVWEAIYGKQSVADSHIGLAASSHDPAFPAAAVHTPSILCVGNFPLSSKPPYISYRNKGQNL